MGPKRRPFKFERIGKKLFALFNRNDVFWVDSSESLEIRTIDETNKYSCYSVNYKNLDKDTWPIASKVKYKCLCC